MKRIKLLRFAGMFTLVAIIAITGFKYLPSATGPKQVTDKEAQEVAPMLAVPMILFSSFDIINELYNKSDR